ncbi:MAG: magnesium/cobalt transporter CorA [Planctomycetota bacterium]|nr:magnesium/cobalt transporter CorA [Planctomycetota bacterium]
MSKHRKRKRGKRFKRRVPAGAPPGTLVSAPDASPSTVRAVAYGPEQVVEKQIADLAQVLELKGKHPVLWVDVVGLGDVKLLERLGEIFGLHRLALEDVINTHQRPKAEEYPEHLFIVAREVLARESILAEQFSLFVGRDFVLTFQEHQDDALNPIRERLRQGGSLVRRLGPDYLTYSILDALIDAYFPVLEMLGEQIENLEIEVVEKSPPDVPAHIQHLKHELLSLRRAVWPLREAVNKLIRDPHPAIGTEARLYFRDCYDHLVQIADFIETDRDQVGSLMELYLSAVSQRMNEVMKVLTIISTIFIPLSFIAGVYGMNFSHDDSPLNMPELYWYWGYPFALLLMFGVAAAMLYFFWRRGWLIALKPGPRPDPNGAADPPGA